MPDCVPLFRRGTGFGNRLFQWARCQVYAQKHGLRVVAPVWAFPRWRPLYMGGVDFRSYLHQIVLLGLFRRHPEEAGLGHLLRLLVAGHRLPEPEDLGTPPPADAPAHSFVPFWNVGGAYHRFGPLDGWHDFLRGRLHAITRPRWLAVVGRHADFAEGAIGINVRRGKDFREAKSKQDFFTKGLLRTPLDWFADCLRLLRREAGRDVPALLVSDGTAADLAPLLACGNVRFARPGCAVSDLLLLSRTRVLIGSGGSSFSAWASYLGRMPTVVHPGQSLTWFGLTSRPGHLVGTLNVEAPEPDVLAELRAALAHEVPRPAGPVTTG